MNQNTDILREQIQNTLIANECALDHVTGGAPAAKEIPIPGTERVMYIGRRADVERLLSSPAAGEEQTGDLPLLPEPTGQMNKATRRELEWQFQSGFSADQMRSFARAAIAAHLARKPKAEQPETSKITDGDSARAFVAEWHRKHFPTDRTFTNYIMGRNRHCALAGDFAWQLAKALESMEGDRLARQAQAEMQAESTLNKVCDLFGIGTLARTESVILTSVRNVLRRDNCLSAVEREFFMVPMERDEDFPDDDPGLECSLRWGADPAEYVEQFRAAITQKFAHPITRAGAQNARRASFSNAGRYCMSEDDCNTAGFKFSSYERGVADAIEACERIAREVGAQNAEAIRNQATDRELLDFLDRWVAENKVEGWNEFHFAFDHSGTAREQIAEQIEIERQEQTGSANTQEGSASAERSCE